MVIDQNQPLLSDMQGEAFMISQTQISKPKSVVAYKRGYELSSWSYSDKLVEVMLNKKNYKFVYGIVENEQGVALQDMEVLVTDNQGLSFTRTTNQIGVFRLILPLDFRLNEATRFQIAGYEILNKSFLENDTAFVAIIKSRKVEAGLPQQNQGFARTIEAQSTIEDLENEDDLENQLKDFYLNEKVQDSLLLQADISSSLEKMIDDIAFDHQFLLKQNQWLERDMRVLNQKIEDIAQLTPERKEQIAAQLRRLETLLLENEILFKTSFKGSMSTIENLRESLKAQEIRLVEIEREKEFAQKEFRRKLIIVTIIVLFLVAVLTVFTVLLQKLREKKKELEAANRTISDVNASLEVKVANRTALLQNAIKELDVFLYKSSHDLRRPLTTFFGLSSLIRVMSGDEKINEILDKINLTASQMDLLLRKLIHIHQINNSSKCQEIDFEALVLKIKTKFDDKLEKQDINMKLDIATDEPLYGDEEILEIIFTYLLDNSLQYGPIHGMSLTIAIGFDVVDGRSMITFSDNGAGIVPDIKDKVFEMFFIGNTNSKGNGLGLYVVKKGVENMGGDITLESIPEQYTTFTISLPGRQSVQIRLAEQLTVQ
ncbi:MAG: HAMP domain-containing histidine kinase [Cyclobacteriaceae bacterium]|nr:HAMP domain-containing histidine kinase [Cyclobacteriaceae bacterium]